MGVKVKYEFIRDIFYFNSDIYFRSKFFILNFGFIVLIFKFCSVKLYMRGEKNNENFIMSLFLIN